MRSQGTLDVRFNGRISLSLVERVWGCELPCGSHYIYISGMHYDWRFPRGNLYYRLPPLVMKRTETASFLPANGQRVI